MPLYPLILKPIYKEKVWGGRALEALGRPLPGGPNVSIGESWELVDLDSTAPSGGGGAAAHSRIGNGPLQLRTMRELMTDLGPQVMGRARPTGDGRFPLLLKYLGARENLSIQVHPSKEYAAAHPEVTIKHEAWYVVSAEPDAVIYKGFERPVSHDEIRAAIEDESLPELLKAVPARPGDVHYLPSGTCHALGKGIVVAEVQTVSDTTFRIFVWGRTDRELHLDAAMECVDTNPIDARAFEVDTPVADGDARGRWIVSTPHFGITQWRIPSGGQKAWSDDRVAVLMIIDGEGEIRWGDDPARSVSTSRGDTVLIPAVLEDAVSHTDGEMTVLEVTLPDAPQP